MCVWSWGGDPPDGLRQLVVALRRWCGGCQAERVKAQQRVNQQKATAKQRVTLTPEEMRAALDAATAVAAVRAWRDSSARQTGPHGHARILKGSEVRRVVNPESAYMRHAPRRRIPSPRFGFQQHRGEQQEVPNAGGACVLTGCGGLVSGQSGQGAAAGDGVQEVRAEAN